MKRDLYAEVSARIIAELEAGAAPWIKPWSATAGANTPCNAVTNRRTPAATSSSCGWRKLPAIARRASKRWSKAAMRSRKRQKTRLRRGLSP